MWYIIGIIVVLLMLSTLRVVKEYERGVIFFLGKCKGIRGPGLVSDNFEQMTQIIANHHHGHSVAENYFQKITFRWMLQA